MALLLPLDKMDEDKISVIFTWDDNSERHYELLAPLFIKHKYKCTFYIVPGTADFKKFQEQYSKLAELGFEIGSHSYTHKYMTNLSESEVMFEFQNSRLAIQNSISLSPLSFAFPHHDYNEDLIRRARDFYLETRNTLVNSERISFKTNSSLISLLHKVKNCISEKRNIVFSGHSVISEQEFKNGNEGEGYEPVRLSILEELLMNISTLTKSVRVLTFIEAALFEYIKSNYVIKNGELIVPNHGLMHLAKYNITRENIRALLW